MSHIQDLIYQPVILYQINFDSLGKSKVFSVQFMPGLNVQFDENSVILFHSTPIGPTTTKMNTHIYKEKILLNN